MRPKPLSKKHESALYKLAHREMPTTHLTPEAAAREIVSRMEARSILAALEYERQRTKEALDFIAKQAKDFAGLPRGQEMDAFLAKHGYQKGEDAPTYSAEHRRKQTAAVVPKAKPRCHCGHLQQNHFNQHAGGGCKVANCGCPRFVCD